MKYTITKQIIQVIGKLWMPGITAAASKTLSAYDLANIGNPKSRRDVERWLVCNTGDFSCMLDFRADFDIDGEHIEHDWADEESELIYNDCMFGGEDE